jgi:hypothetical protein
MSSSRRTSLDFSEALGRFARNPAAEIDRTPSAADSARAGTVVALGGISMAVSNALERGASLDLFLFKRILASVIVAAAMWGLASFFWHFLSRLFKHPGDFRAFLCRTGWAALLFWPAAALALCERTLPSAALAFELISRGLVIGAIYLVWRSLKVTYAWTGGKALLILLLPPLVGSSLAAAVGLLVALSIAGGAILGKLL